MYTGPGQGAAARTSFSVLTPSQGVDDTTNNESIDGRHHGGQYQRADQPATRKTGIDMQEVDQLDANCSRHASIDERNVLV